MHEAIDKEFPNNWTVIREWVHGGEWKVEKARGYVSSHSNVFDKMRGIYMRKG